MIRIPTLALAALLGAALPILAQEKAPSPAAQAQAALEPPPDLAVLKAMKSRVFVLRYADPLALMRIINPLRSGVRGSDTSYANDPGLRAISVRDFPENLAAIEEAVKRLDIPATAQSSRDVELQIQVLFASAQATPDTDLPQDLAPVLRSLRGTLGFRGYTLAARLSQRVRVNENRFIQGRGQIEGGALGLGTAKEPRTLVFEWGSSGMVQEGAADGPSSFAMRTFRFTLKDADTSRNLAELDTGLSLKEGEHVVVGTSMVKGHGVIVVLSVRRAG